LRLNRTHWSKIRGMLENAPGATAQEIQDATGVLRVRTSLWYAQRAGRIHIEFAGGRYRYYLAQIEIRVDPIVERLRVEVVA
jgi:hypothetical protein